MRLAQASAQVAQERVKAGGWHPVDWACELVGTFVLLFAGFSVVAILQSPQSPVSSTITSEGLRLALIGAAFGALSGLIALSPPGRRSGAHLNPAVTTAFWGRGQTHVHDLIGYVTAQVTGAIAATSAFALALGSWARDVDFARTSPREGLPGIAALGIEAGLVFCLVLSMLLMLSSERTARWTPLVQGLLLAALIRTGAPPTGASLNPARTLGPDVIAGAYDFLWIYIAGPVVGALAATVAFGALASGRSLLTAKLFHDQRYPTTHASRLPVAVAGRVRGGIPGRGRSRR